MNIKIFRALNRFSAKLDKKTYKFFKGMPLFRPYTPKRFNKCVALKKVLLPPVLSPKEKKLKLSI